MNAHLNRGARTRLLCRQMTFRRDKGCADRRWNLAGRVTVDNLIMWDMFEDNP
jgi:hypothetical protein